MPTVLSHTHWPPQSSARLTCADEPFVRPSALAIRNMRMMAVLARVALRLNEAGVPLMVLKGAALNLRLYQRPDARPMGDLDLMVREADLPAAREAIERCGGLRSVSQVREDFFPRYHYEIEYTLGAIYPVKIDLHVRPFRLLRYARTVPAGAFWENAVSAPVQSATVLQPSPTDMLLHLMAHSSVHGNTRELWLQDIALWVRCYAGQIDWQELVEKACRWKLSLASRLAATAVEARFGPVFPPNVLRILKAAPVGWRDRLPLWQAPRDAEHPIAHVCTSFVCTPGLRFGLGYLSAIAFPGRAFMAEGYAGRHVGWLAAAHALRLCRPLLGRTRFRARLRSRIEVRPSPIHGVGVFAGRCFRAGDVIAHFHAEPTDRAGAYIAEMADRTGRHRRLELIGKVRFLNHSCAPNAELRDFALVALQPIAADDELTIDYGPAACNCRSSVSDPDPPQQELAHDAA